MVDLKFHNNDIKKLCIKNDVRSLYVFGSYANGNATNKSDLDLMVDINATEPLLYAEHYFDLKFGLEELLKIEIDLLEYKAISNAYFKLEFKKNKQLIYGQ